MAEFAIPIEVKQVRIPEQQVFGGKPFPLVLNPADDHREKNSDFWKDWVERHRGDIEHLLVVYGAILFREFPFETPANFDDFAGAFGYKDFPYEGLAVRNHIVGNVYTSVEQPIEVSIPFHHEMAHVRDYPHVLFFYVDLPPTKGGETPILLSNEVYRKMAELEPELVSRMEKEALRYVRVAPDVDDIGSHCGRSWKSTFKAETKQEAEVKAKVAGYDIEWLEDGSLRTITPELPGIRVDKRTGKKVWFNTIYNAITAWGDSRNDSTKTVVFSNGDTIPISVVKSLDKAIDEAKVSFGWQRKDVLLIDNRTVQHARAANWIPPRRILASLYTDSQGLLSSINEAQ